MGPCPTASSRARPPRGPRGWPRCRWGTPGAPRSGSASGSVARPAETVLTEIQQRTAEQLFRTLGELKGGAMKFGQALSVLEAALPEEMAGPYREQLTRLQDAAPPMPTQTVRDQLEQALGPDWKEQLVWLDGGPTAAASIGQVHKGRWHDGREVAVKVQYPGAGEALMSDLRQLARLGRTIGAAGARASTSSRWSRRCRPGPSTSSTTSSRPRRSTPSPRRSRGDPDIVVPDVVAGRRHGPGHRVAGEPGLAGRDHPRRHPGGARPLRRAVRPLPLRRPEPHRHAARRPAPRELPDPARTTTAAPAGSASSTSARSPGWTSAALPDGDGPADPDRRDRGPRGAAGGAARRGVHQGRGSGSTPTCCSTTSSPFVEPTQVERFRFTREWMRSQFQRINNPREPTYTVAMKLNLPPSYLLIHRTWLGGIGVLSQLEAEAPFRAILTEYLPGFAVRPSRGSRVSPATGA